MKLDITRPTNDVGKPLEDVAMTNIQQSKREEWIKQTSFCIDQFLSRLGNGSAGKTKETLLLSVI